MKNQLIITETKIVILNENPMKSIFIDKENKKVIETKDKIIIMGKKSSDIQIVHK